MELRLYRRYFSIPLLACVLLISCLGMVLPARGHAARALVGAPATQDSAATVSGTVIHILETPAEVAGNPSVASINNSGISCAVSFGNNMGAADNFSMVVYSEEVGDTRVIGRMAIQWGKARSITIENGEIMESVVYDYLVMVIDERELDGDDHWSMTLWGEGLMFNGVTFSGPVTVGDLVVQP